MKTNGSGLAGLELSFVGRVRGRARFWTEPPARDYAAASRAGARNAREFIAFQKANPAWKGSGLLGRVATDIARHGHPGHAAGFFAEIERALR